MPNADPFDPSHFGYWPTAPTDNNATAWSDEDRRREVEALFLETKSGDPREVLRGFLEDMSVEMRAQFVSFRKLRVAADTIAEANAAGEGCDEAAAKLARADVKSAVDAMSLIVRTLEKVDALQRQIARDHELEKERHADGPGYEEARKRLFDIVEQRVNDRVQAILAERDLAGDVADEAPVPGSIGAASGSTGPPQGRGLAT